MKIVGIDPSLTCTGVAVINDNIKTYTIQSKKRGAERLIEIRDALSKEVKDADMVVIESYAYCRANQAHQIGELGGVIRIMLVEAGVGWLAVAPAQLKKFATGKGNAKKEHILQQVYKRWGVEFETSDEADAFVLAKIGQALAEDVRLTNFQEKVIEKLREMAKNERRDKTEGDRQHQDSTSSGNKKNFRAPTKRSGYWV